MLLNIIRYAKRQGECLGQKKGATHFHTLLELQDKGWAIKELVARWTCGYVIIQFISEIKFIDTSKYDHCMETKTCF